MTPKGNPLFKQEEILKNPEICEYFRPIQAVGSGSFGSVLSAVDLVSKKTVAVKVRAIIFLIPLLTTF